MLGSPYLLCYDYLQEQLPLGSQQVDTRYLCCLT
jgi:hypothetical protein